MKSRTGVLVALAAGAAVGVRARGKQRNVPPEPLPGDELLPDATTVSTHERSIAAPPSAVWPWLAQLGQNKAGFYTYTALENLMGCQMPDVTRIVPEWQEVTVGDRVHLAPELYLTAAMVEPGRHLVLRGDPEGAPPGVEMPFAFTWAFVVRDAPGGSLLLTRERYLPVGLAGRLQVTAGVLGSAVMTRKMLATIARLAEAGARG